MHLFRRSGYCKYEYPKNILQENEDRQILIDNIGKSLDILDQSYSKFTHIGFVFIKDNYLYKLPNKDYLIKLKKIEKCTCSENIKYYVNKYVEKRLNVKNIWNNFVNMIPMIFENYDNFKTLKYKNLDKILMIVLEWTPELNSQFLKFDKVDLWHKSLYDIDNNFDIILTSVIFQEIYIDPEGYMKHIEDTS